MRAHLAVTQSLILASAVLAGGSLWAQTATSSSLDRTTGQLSCQVAGKAPVANTLSHAMVIASRAVGMARRVATTSYETGPGKDGWETHLRFDFPELKVPLTHGATARIKGGGKTGPNAVGASSFSVDAGALVLVY